MFVDIEIVTFNSDADEVRKVITPKTKGAMLRDILKIFHDSGKLGVD